MHPAMMQQLAAERVRDMIADADNARRARLARRIRRSRTPVHTTRPDLPGMHVDPLPDGAERQPDDLALHPAAGR